MTRSSHRVRKINQKYDNSEWVSLVREIKEEEEPWKNFGDLNLFIPEPKGLRITFKLRQKDPIVFKFWSSAICAELKDLITQGTFGIVNSEKEDKIVPTTLVLKVKLNSEGNWDKNKARICIHSDVKNMESQEDTWAPISSKKTLRLFLTDAAKHK